MKGFTNVLNRAVRPTCSQKNASTSPEKISPGADGAMNYYGLGASGYRLRVTLSSDGTTIKTLAWADRRKQGSHYK